MFGIEDFTKKIVDFANFDVSQLGDALVFGGAILLIGMVAIFAVLVILWIFLVFFKFVFHDLPARSKNVKKVVPETVVPVEETVTVSTEDEIVAAIAAAIAMAESESDGIKFKVVSFKRK